MRCPRIVTLLHVLTLAIFAGVFASQLSRPVAVAAAPLPADQQQAPPTPQPGYVGTETCATCHTGYDTSVAATKHGQVKNPRAPMAAQGCETCHGPARRTRIVPKSSSRAVQQTSAKQVTDT